jgi:hypothetical protein
MGGCIKVERKEVEFGSVNWILLAQVGVQWLAVAKAIMILQVQ